MPNQREVQQWLDTAECLTRLTGEQQREVEEIIGKPGLLHLLGLMMGARQGFYIQLSNMALYSDAGRHSAAVLQGTIKGVDLLPQTLLELFPAVEA